MRWAGRELFNMDCLVEATSYPFALIKYVITGRSVLHSNSAKWAVEPGMAVWIGPKTAWSHLPDDDSKPVNYVLMLVGDEIPDLFERNLGSQVGCTPLAHPYRVESLMEEIMREGRLRGSRFEDNCLCLSRVLIDRISADMARGAKPLNVARATYERCYDFIAANYNAIAGLGQIADSCHISVPYLCRLFEQFGETSPAPFSSRNNGCKRRKCCSSEARCPSCALHRSSATTAPAISPERSGRIMECRPPITATNRALSGLSQRPVI